MPSDKQRGHWEGRQWQGEAAADNQRQERHLKDVDFNALNFEQRRAPYDSGARFISDGGDQTEGGPGDDFNAH